MNIFRIKINPSGSGASPHATFKYCLDNGILGVGWQIDHGIGRTTDWETYARHAESEYGDKKAIQVPRYIKDNVRIDDLVWTRGPNGSKKYEGKYYLARITGEWEYRPSPDVDIGNVFACDIKEVSADNVPGKVIRSWRGKTIQRVNEIENYSKFVWNKLVGNEYYSVDETKPCLFQLLDAWETEDVLALFLQHIGWRFVPNSANHGTTQKYEFLVTKPGEKPAWTQVKSGGTCIDLSWYKDAGHEVIVWQPNGHYCGDKPPNVTCICSETVLEFVRTEQNWLPKWLINKAKLSDI